MPATTSTTTAARVSLNIVPRRCPSFILDGHYQAQSLPEEKKDLMEADVVQDTHGRPLR